MKQGNSTNQLKDSAWLLRGKSSFRVAYDFLRFILVLRRFIRQRIYLSFFNFPDATLFVKFASLTQKHKENRNRTLKSGDLAHE